MMPARDTVAGEALARFSGSNMAWRGVVTGIVSVDSSGRHTQCAMFNRKQGLVPAQRHASTILLRPACQPTFMAGAMRMRSPLANVSTCENEQNQNEIPLEGTTTFDNLGT